MHAGEGTAVIWYTGFAAQFARRRDKNIVSGDGVCVLFLCLCGHLYLSCVKKEKLMCRGCNGCVFRRDRDILEEVEFGP